LSFCPIRLSDFLREIAKNDLTNKKTSFEKQKKRKKGFKIRLKLV
jgi:hypothetical protein